MGDISRFIIDGSTSEILQTFVREIRQDWGEKQYTKFDVRVLPDKPKDCIHSFLLVDREGGQPVHCVFQHGNSYFIAWGTDPDKMIIFDDQHSNFEVEENEEEYVPTRVGKKSKKVSTIKQRDGTKKKPPPTYRSASGVDYQLTNAQKCGLNSDYGSLEKQGGARELIKVGREALIGAFFEFKKEFVPKKDPRQPNYIKKISSSSISFLQTFPESFRSDKILKAVSKIYEPGGLLPAYVVIIENEWLKNSAKGHKFMSESTILNRRKRKFVRDLGLILGGKKVQWMPGKK